MNTSSTSPERFLAPDIIHGNRFNFTPIGPAPPTVKCIPQTVRPVPTNPDGNRQFRRERCPFDYPGESIVKSHKRKPLNNEIFNQPSPSLQMTGEPQRKVHLTDEYVAQTMSELYISNPKPKVARRDCNRDVAEAINLESLNDLEERFANHAINEEYNLPPLRNRKLPRRNPSPQLRLTIHQDLKNLKTSNVIPEALISRYRPTPRQGSTALVLWKPPGGTIPDLITSTWKQKAGRTRCLSEVTTTPYSSQENLIDSDTCENSVKSYRDNMTSNQSPVSAEAPELSSPSMSEEEVIPSVKLNRRNSAPEISEPVPFLDHEGSMEL